MRTPYARRLAYLTARLPGFSALQIRRYDIRRCAYSLRQVLLGQHGPHVAPRVGELICTLCLLISCHKEVTSSFIAWCCLYKINAEAKVLYVLVPVYGQRSSQNNHGRLAGTWFASISLMGSNRSKAELCYWADCTAGPPQFVHAQLTGSSRYSISSIRHSEVLNTMDLFLWPVQPRSPFGRYERIRNT